MTNLSESDTQVAEAASSEAEADLAPSEDIGAEASQTEDTPDVPAEPEYDYLDTESVSGKYVKVKVDGEEVSVPIDEALQGYQRQADYSRKTQEVAAQRAEADNALRLAQALQSNPGLTMQVLANQAGMSVQDFLGLSPNQQAQAAEQASAEPEYSDPVERALAEQRQEMASLRQIIEQREADERLNREIAGLNQQFGASEEDVRAVVGQALEMGVGPEMFPLIYQAQLGQKYLAQQQAQQQSTEQRSQQEAQRQAAARQQAQIVGDSTSATGLQPAPVAGQPMSIQAALEAALNEHGVS